MKKGQMMVANRDSPYKFLPEGTVVKITQIEPGFSLFNAVLAHEESPDEFHHLRAEYFTEYKKPNPIQEPVTVKMNGNEITVILDNGAIGKYNAPTDEDFSFGKAIMEAYNMAVDKKVEMDEIFNVPFAPGEMVQIRFLSEFDEMVKRGNLIEVTEGVYTEKGKDMDFVRSMGKLCGWTATINSNNGGDITLKDLTSPYGDIQSYSFFTFRPWMLKKV